MLFGVAPTTGSNQAMQLTAPVCVPLSVATTLLLEAKHVFAKTYSRKMKD